MEQPLDLLIFILFYLWSVRRKEGRAAGQATRAIHALPAATTTLGRPDSRWRASRETRGCRVRKFDICISSFNNQPSFRPCEKPEQGTEPRSKERAQGNNSTSHGHTC